MTCDRPKVQLYLYLDGELALPEATEFEQHLQMCSSCQQEAVAHHRLQSLLQTALPEEDVPEGVWASICRQLPSPSAPSWRATRWLTWKRLGGAGVAAAALFLLAFTVRLWFSPAAPLIIREIVDSQIRARLMQVSYHQVPAKLGSIRRWFDGQVEFSPPLPVIPQAHYTLLGVRLNYFLNRRVAEIAYASDSHVLSFLMFSAQDISLNSLRTVRVADRTFYTQSYKGYNTVLWQDGEVFCSLVSDLHLAELLQVARQAVGNPPAS